MKVKLSQLKENPANPRYIRDDNFKKLVQSIRDFPEMLKVRKVVCTPDFVVLGGNMRLKALKEAGVKEVEVEIVDWPEEKQKQFIIKDNVGYGQWDWESLANEWEAKDLNEWGLDIPHIEDPDLDYIFDVERPPIDLMLQKLIMNFQPEEYTKVKEGLKKHGETPELALKSLLGIS